MASTCKSITAALGIVFALVGMAHIAAAAEPPVKMWQEPLVIPTYEVGPAERNPIFYTGRGYQGAKGPVYPYPLLDKLTDVKKDKTYQAIYLENKYVKFSILPELGGRIFSALDKTNNYDFIYRQHVIKPALIGMAGAWISGGVEWNIPHHHRASTFMPVDYKLAENADGSKTVWLGEIELRHRMKWLVGLTLYPDRSYLEVTVKLINRTPFAHSILYFANIAVHANRDYQVIFPPGTEYGTQHGKSEFVNWPIAQGRYGGIDRTGVDVSWWKNNPTPVSIFAWNYEDDFFGGYDHGKRAGIACIADHHAAPGKKFFEWGAGPEGRMWEKMLTDSDGPYLELMAGAWSDNQPDYSWIQPYETKTVKQYFYPIRELGGIKKANLDAAVNLDVDEKGVANIAVNTTKEFATTKVLLRAGEKTLFEKDTAIAPEKPFHGELKVPATVKLEDLKLSLTDTSKRAVGVPAIIGYQPVKPKGAPMPKPVEPPPAPKDVKTNEELYLIGLRLEQFYSPALEPYPYYEEALRRDPGDYRANTALGILYLKRGMYDEAEQRFNAAIERAAKNYTKPRDGEAYYYLGVALRAQNKLDAAENAFQKAAWSHAWSAAANYLLADVAWHRETGDSIKLLPPSCYEQNPSEALTFLERAILRNAENPKALALKAVVLRCCGRAAEAERAARAALDVDPLDFWAERERELADASRFAADHAKATRRTATLSHLEQAAEYAKLFPSKDASGFAREYAKATRRASTLSYLELAADYANCGCWREARGILGSVVESTARQDKDYVQPLVLYHLTYYCEQDGIDVAGAGYRGGAKAMRPDYCFPFQLESIHILRRAADNDPSDARAPYYLGNLLYDIQPQNAVAAWEESRKRDDKFAIVHRNLALAYAQIEKDVPKAVASLEKAVACDPKDPKFYAELDTLYEAANTPPEKRLALLERNHETVLQRDDSLAREIALDILFGKCDRAIDLLANHHFHLWEGGSGVHDLYVDAHLLRGQQRLKADKYAEALKDFEAALEYPENLEASKPRRGGGRTAQIAYLTGTAHEALGDKDKARRHYQQAAEAKHDWSELSYYQALSYRKLDQESKAVDILDGLVRHAENLLEAAPAVDFFAKFGSRQSESARKAQAHWLLGLGYLGKGRAAEAKQQFHKALELNVSHLGARTMTAAMP